MHITHFLCRPGLVSTANHVYGDWWHDIFHWAFTKLVSHTLSWATPLWSSPIASVIYFSPQVTSAFSTTAFSSGPMALLPLSQRTRRLCRVHPQLSMLIYVLLLCLTACSSKLGGRKCLAPIRVTLSAGTFMMSPGPSGIQHFFWSASPPPHFVLLYFSFLTLNPCLSYSHLKHRGKENKRI